MRRIPFSLLFILNIICYSCNNKDTKITIEFTKPVSDKVIYLSKINNFNFIAGWSSDKNALMLIDSVKIKDNKVVFSPNIENNNGLYRVDFLKGFDNKKAIYLDLKRGDHININCDPDNTRSYLLKGNKNNKHIQTAFNELGKMFKEVEEFWNKRNKMSEMKLDINQFLKQESKLERELSELIEEQFQNYLKLLKKSFEKHEYSGLIALQLLYYFPVKRDKIDFLNNLIPSIDNNLIKQFLLTKISQDENNLAEIERSKNMKGKLIPDIELSSIDGNSFKLSKKLSKITLIDFWASWCNPCINENNKVILPLYKEYHKLGFEIIGISLDRDIENWKKSIEKNKYIWPHGIKKNSSISLNKLYNFSTIPYTIIVDENGLVLDIDIKGQELKELLIKTLKNK
ncbi:TlpA disulfide reductase family protein [uncultured Tenacibaculum sp.]|uniref:TlpA disulfide reductase family protein n=1 Tax=uncultured Tenacibaculum sp. TaxID=174713 RepID=UPI00261DF004|nr:TlpA disulfide reductase family protein [uncultured Tenacibaculum sp.]